MSPEVAAPRAPERHGDERDDQGGEDCVRQQDEEIDRPDVALSRKTRRAVVVVIDQIGREKDTGDDERGGHATQVRGDPAAADEIKTCEKEQPARRIEQGIDVRQL
jgi:hypothetical protein